MFGLDDRLAGASQGAPVGVVLLVAVLLGLRHATDPDHVAAVTTLVAGGREGAARGAARLGAWWGLGHGTTLVAFGLPIVLFGRYLPQRLEQGAETAVAVVIVVLALRLLARWRHGRYDAHVHGRGEHRHPVRTPHAAFGIGLVHGTGGSAGVGVLLLAAIPSPELAVTSLLLLAAFTGVSMTVLSTGFGAVLSSPAVSGAVAGAIPAIGLLSLAFGCWYAAAAWSLAP